MRNRVGAMKNWMMANRSPWLETARRAMDKQFLLCKHRRVVASEPIKPEEPESKRWIPGTPNIVWPSLAYKEHCASYTNRLSESVFGSLLAAYILGFLAFGMNLVGGIASWKSAAELFTSLKLLQIIEYLAISGTFSYLTAAYYVTYHNSILTMPQIPPHKLRADFGIALTQAVLFGLSMIRPDAFPLFVGLSLLRVFWRQWDVFSELSSMFSRVKQQSGDNRVDPKIERQQFKQLLLKLNADKKYSYCLEGWLPVTWKMYLFTGVLITVGGVSELRHFFEWGRDWLPPHGIGPARVQAMVYFLLFAVVWLFTDRVFQKGAAHPMLKNESSLLAIDHAAEEIVKELKSGVSKTTSS